MAGRQPDEDHNDRSNDPFWQSLQSWLREERELEGRRRGRKFELTVSSAGSTDNAGIEHENQQPEALAGTLKGFPFVLSPNTLFETLNNVDPQTRSPLAFGEASAVPLGRFEFHGNNVQEKEKSQGESVNIQHGGDHVNKLPPLGQAMEGGSQIQTPRTGSYTSSSGSPTVSDSVAGLDGSLKHSRQGDTPPISRSTPAQKKRKKKNDLNEDEINVEEGGEEGSRKKRKKTKTTSRKDEPNDVGRKRHNVVKKKSEPEPSGDPEEEVNVETKSKDSRSENSKSASGAKPRPRRNRRKVEDLDEVNLSLSDSVKAKKLVTLDGSQAPHSFMKHPKITGFNSLPQLRDVSGGEEPQDECAAEPKKKRRKKAAVGEPSKPEDLFNYTAANFWIRHYISTMLPDTQVDEIEAMMRVCLEANMEVILQLDFKDLCFLEEIYERQARLHGKFLEMIGVPGVVVNRSAQFLYANKAALDLLEIDAADIPETNFHSVIDPKGLYAFLKVFVGIVFHPVGQDSAIIDSALCRAKSKEKVCVRVFGKLHRDPYTLPGTVTLLIFPYTYQPEASTFCLDSVAIF